MSTRERANIQAIADGRFQVENMILRWALVALYALFAFTGIIDVALPWFLATEGFLVVFHLYYTWCVWREHHNAPLPGWLANTTPFIDTLAVSLVLVAIGDPLHPVWGAYFLVSVDSALFVGSIARLYTLWLAGLYALVGLGVHARGLDVDVPYMIVAGVLLVAGVYNFVTYISNEWRLRQRLTDVARTDPLTNLLNRRGLEEALADRLRTDGQEQQIAVFMVDVDRFKRINDRLGHVVADGVLERLADQLAASARPGDVAARYGGDEFVMIIHGVTTIDAMTMAERLRAQVARLGLCTVSIGVSTSNGRSGVARELIDEADAALLSAKHGGRNCVRGPAHAAARVA